MSEEEVVTQISGDQEESFLSAFGETETTEEVAEETTEEVPQTEEVVDQTAEEGATEGVVEEAVEDGVAGFSTTDVQEQLAAFQTNFQAQQEQIQQLTNQNAQLLQALQAQAPKEEKGPDPADEFYNSLKPEVRAGMQAAIEGAARKLYGDQIDQLKQRVDQTTQTESQRQAEGIRTNLAKKYSEHWNDDSAAMWDKAVNYAVNGTADEVAELCFFAQFGWSKFLQEREKAQKEASAQKNKEKKQEVADVHAGTAAPGKAPPKQDNGIPEGFDEMDWNQGLDAAIRQAFQERRAN